jgi:aminoglycoside/choline kinase family phosphotransferase
MAARACASFSAVSLALADAAAWLAEQGVAPLALEPMAGDVSPRRYLRVRAAGGATAILAAYPEAARDSGVRFAATTALLERGGVRVPRILAFERERGLMLLEDVGARTLYDLEGEPWDLLESWFARAVEAAARIRALPPPEVAALSPPLDRALLERELEKTCAVFLGPRGLLGDARERGALESALGELCARLAALAPLPCHRDFMARNLVPLASGEIAVLDHQDLRLGPPEYDVASLLNDSLFPPPPLESRLLALAPPAADPLSYRRAAAQRTLKAVGTFAAFAARGADRHLRLIPPTLRRALGHLAALPELEPLVPELRRRWAAAC